MLWYVPRYAAGEIDGQDAVQQVYNRYIHPLVGGRVYVPLCAAGEDRRPSFDPAVQTTHSTLLSIRQNAAPRAHSFPVSGVLEQSPNFIQT